jgi:hypothetical protein
MEFLQISGVFLEFLGNSGFFMNFQEFLGIFKNFRNNNGISKIKGISRISGTKKECRKKGISRICRNF